MAKNKKGVIDKKMFSTAFEAFTQKRAGGTVSIGPALDDKLKGGIPEGSVVLVRTLAKVGKTATLMQFAKNALDQGRWVVFADVELRLNPVKYFNIQGFDMNHPKFLILRSQKDNILSGEQIYETIMHMMQMPKYRGAVYLIDSFSKITPQSTLDDEHVRADRRDSTPKLNSDFCKKVGNLTRVSQSIVIGTQHFITNTSQYGDKLLPDGGVKLEYECDITLEARHKPYDYDGNRINITEDQPLEGQRIQWQIPYNAMGSPYVSKESPVMSYIRFGEGIYFAKEAFDLLTKIGLILTEKSWYTFLTDKITDKVHGKEKAIALIDANKEYFQNIIREYFINEYQVNYNFEPNEDDTDD